MDWVAGIIFTLISYWLGEIAATRPELWPGFFEVDLAPSILEFMCRDDVQLWFTSVPPLLFAVEGMSLLKNTKQQAADYATTSDGDNQLLFAVFMAVVLFCIHGLRVFWPKSFEGDVFYALLIFYFMVVSHVVFLAINILQIASNGSIFVEVTTMVTTIRLYGWMMPWAAPPIFDRPDRELEESLPWHYRSLGHFVAQYNIVTFCVIPVVLEVCLPRYVRKFHDFPETLYSPLFLCCSLVPIWRGFSPTIPQSWIDRLTSVWERAYDSIRNVGSEAMAYVSGVYNRP